MKKGISTLVNKKKLRVAGLMSGTSADGVDAVIVDISRAGIKTVAFDTFRYGPSLRQKVFCLFNLKKARLDDVSFLNFALGEFFAQAVIKLCKKSSIALKSIDLIGSHGQTVYHQPKPGKFAGKLIRSTFQIGELSVIAERTGAITVGDFRCADIAAGGEGAPLVPYADFVLFADKRRNRAIQNIGGIANVTYLPACAKLSGVLAFDTGPGNMVIDGIVNLLSNGAEKYDKNGRAAARGIVNAKLLKEYFIEIVVVILTCVDNYMVAAVIQCFNDAAEPDDLRPGTEYGEYLHYWILSNL